MARSGRDIRDRIVEFRKGFARRRSRAMVRPRERGLYAAGTPQDVTSPRAKSQRHGKVTADHWNQ